MNQAMKLKVTRFELFVAHFQIALGQRVSRLEEAGDNVVIRLGLRLEAATERRAEARGVCTDALLEPLLARGYWRSI